MGTPIPLLKRGQRRHIFSSCLLWPNGWMDKDGTWYGGRPRPSDVVLDGKPAPKRCTVPSFWPICVCGQTAEWMKMPLGTEVDLSPSHCVTREPSSSPGKGPSSSLFSVRVLILAMVAHLGYTAELLSRCGISFTQQSNISKVHTHRSFIAQKAQCIEQDNSLPVTVNLPQAVPAGRG